MGFKNRKLLNDFPTIFAYEDYVQNPNIGYNDQTNLISNSVKFKMFTAKFINTFNHCMGFDNSQNFYSSLRITELA